MWFNSPASAANVATATQPATRKDAAQVPPRKEASMTRSKKSKVSAVVKAQKSTGKAAPDGAKATVTISPNNGVVRVVSPTGANPRTIEAIESAAAYGAYLHPNTFIEIVDGCDETGEHEQHVIELQRRLRDGSRITVGTIAIVPVRDLSHRKEYKKTAEAIAKNPSILDTMHNYLAIDCRHVTARNVA